MVDVHLLTQKLNEFRVKNLGKTFTRGEAIEGFRNLGFNSRISQDLLRFMSFEQMGSARLYQFGKEPIYEGRVKGLYEAVRAASAKSHFEKNEKLVVEEALEFLKGQGYRIQRVIGFDETRFKQDHPDLYRKYLQYEVL